MTPIPSIWWCHCVPLINLLQDRETIVVFGILQYNRNEHVLYCHQETAKMKKILYLIWVKGRISIRLFSKTAIWFFPEKDNRSWRYWSRDSWFGGLLSFLHVKLLERIREFDWNLGDSCTWTLVRLEIRWVCWSPRLSGGTVRILVTQAQNYFLTDRW